MKRYSSISAIVILMLIFTLKIDSVGDLATGAKRFTVSSDGVISDSETSLEWVVGPDRDTTYEQARQWVASCKTAGGGWRMPTRKELATLYQKGFGKRNMDPAFKITGWYVWAGPRSSRTAWGFNFTFGIDGWIYLDHSSTRRGFAVRSRR